MSQKRNYTIEEIDFKISKTKNKNNRKKLFRLRANLINSGRMIVQQEREEIIRTIREEEIGKISVSYLENMFVESNPVELDNEIWERLVNSDSQFVTTEKEVKMLLKHYNRSPDVYSPILGAIKSGNCPPPLIIKHRNQHYLVAGNTRLMICKVNGITPIVKIVEIV